MERFLRYGTTIERRARIPGIAPGREAADRVMSRPVHLCIRDDLRARIGSGEWGAGQRLPSETDLAAWYGVARMTIRQAVGALAAEGVLVRRQGLGTFVADPMATRRGSYLRSYTAEVRGQGHEVRTRLIRAAIEQPPAAVRAALHLGEATIAILVRRLRIVDGLPTLLQTSWLPYSRFAGLESEPLLDGSLYAMLEGPYGVRMARASQQVSATAADESEAGPLGLRPRDPVLRIVRTVYDDSSLAIEQATGTMRPGCIIETTVEREP
jgi:GntR family transcriptional regulator